MNKIIQIAIADDHPMVISGLKNMLINFPEIAFNGEYTNGAELLDGLTVSRPDVLLLDIQMPDKTGAELLPAIMKKYPDLCVLVLTNLDSVLYVFNMLKYGAKGYLLKTTSQEILIEAIKTVSQGTLFLEKEIKEKLDDFTAHMRREASLKATLTQREKEILIRIVKGETSKEISDNLCLGYRTVESYRFNIMLKLDVKNTASLVRKALELGIIDYPL